MYAQQTQSGVECESTNRMRNVLEEAHTHTLKLALGMSLNDGGRL